MKRFRFGFISLIITIGLLIGLSSVVYAEGNPLYIDSWKQRWEVQPSSQISTDWIYVQLKDGIPPVKPRDVKALTITFDIPASSEEQSLYIPMLHAMNVTITFNETTIYTSVRDYTYDQYRIFTSLPDLSNGGVIKIYAQSEIDRIGLQSGVYIGSHDLLERMNARAHIREIAFGGAFIFVALAMYASLWFLKRTQWGLWLTLSTMFLSIGVMIITYEPFIYMYLNSLVKWLNYLFDIALFYFLPAITYFFERIFRPDKSRVLTIFRKGQVIYSLFLYCALVIHIMTDARYHTIYFFLSVTLLGFIMLVQFPLIAIITTKYARRGNREAVILAFGIGAFAIAGMVDLITFYLLSMRYDLYWWKVGAVLFFVSLLFLLGRRMADNHKKVIQYSSELQDYIGKMHQSEKIEVIHELAPSIAQEVNEPLDKTKGLLMQIAGRTEQGTESGHIKLAIEELERASSILNDYFHLMDTVDSEQHRLHIRDELIQVSEIVQPYAQLHGGLIELEAEDNLYIYGNRDRFRQSLLNLIKNSIEALNGKGNIRLSAYKERESIVIVVADNGGGMDDETLNHLGNAYFTSGKTYGTGLGLMTTFQLIERMNGTLSFTSQLGQGTQAFIRIPAADGME
ncbi:sensor histidine kinase [Paenibacillus xylaniclasticus]|uniref:sensor histidine kinase n=1 Tax=Paenibacillus xylaniclasticus TaxID=588083 RepID=UPI000FDC4CF7|nr:MULTISPECIES: sensor histidine kinase [Paenibacillus]GFN32987.1 hypothetical protein PCURB6_32470 [Paenibacillus curdlanolyticus]